MPAPRFSDDDFLAAGQALLPRGAAWPRARDATLTRAVAGLQRTPARLHGRAADLLDNEAYPATTYELLGDWERAFGLPDGCTPISDGLVARREALLVRIAGQGGQSRAYFIGLALRIGITITIDEFRPFRVGINRCGDRLNGGGWIHAWRVNAASVTPRPFLVGQDGAGTRLRRWGYGPLECVLTRLKPAHTVILFSYGGVAAPLPFFFRAGFGRVGDPLRAL